MGSGEVPMNPFSLIPAPYRIVGYFVASLAVVGTVYLAANKAYSWAYDNGVTAEKLMWESRESEELASANKKILDLTDKARKDEAQHNLNLATISTEYEEYKKNDKLKNDKVIADLNTGVIRLRDKYANTIGQATCTSGVSETTASTSERNGETGTELSTKTSEFLYRLASESDDVVKQLTACQAVVIEDRRLCGIK